MNANIKQQGFSLLVTLVMLVVMTLLAIASFHLSINQTTVVANSQHKNEGVDAATQAIEIIVNSSNFTKNPAAAIPNSNCINGVGNTWCVDSNGDGIQDFQVTMPAVPKCIEAAPIPNSQLNLQKADDLACSAGTQQNFGVAGATGAGNSMCANSTWEILAKADDPATETSATVAQGVNVRIAATDMANNCP